MKRLTKRLMNLGKKTEQVFLLVKEHIHRVKIWQWYVLAFIALVIGGVSYLTLRYIAEPFLETTFSTIGNMPGAYWQFVVGGIVLGTIGAFVVAEIFKRLDVYQDKYLRILFHLSLIFMFGIAVVPYTHSLPFLRIVHTAIGWVAALNFVLLMMRVRKMKTFSHPWKNKFLKYMPHITGLGTLSLYAATGLNLLMEFFFFGSLLCWILIMGLVKE